MSFLTIEQSISLLPSQFEDIVKCPGRRPIYSSSMGNLYFRGSKDFGYMHKTWWYSIDPEIIKNERIAYIVLAADVKGIFIIPSSIFFAFLAKDIVPYKMQLMIIARELSPKIVYCYMSPIV